MKNIGRLFGSVNSPGSLIARGVRRYEEKLSGTRVSDISGNTIPVKLQVQDAGNNNMSSYATSLVTRDLIRVIDNTSARVVDSGDATR